MKILRHSIIVACILALAGGCANKKLLTRTDPVPPVAKKKEVAEDKRPSYTIKGKKYYPLDKVPRGSVQKGTASWYGPGFHGKATSSGEIYDMHEMTAAHSILPLGTVVRVVNVENRKNVTVRINDRGPFVDDRVIDLSLAAAKKLDMIKPGIAPVKLTVLKSGDKAKGQLVKRKITPPAAPNPYYRTKILARAN